MMDDKLRAVDRDSGGQSMSDHAKITENDRKLAALMIFYSEEGRAQLIADAIRDAKVKEAETNRAKTVAFHNSSIALYFEERIEKLKRGEA